jgi:hypothetical protein
MNRNTEYRIQDTEYSVTDPAIDDSMAKDQEPGTRNWTLTADFADYTDIGRAKSKVKRQKAKGKVAVSRGQ